MGISASALYRPLDAVSAAAAYIDGEGVILSANDALRDLWRAIVMAPGPAEGKPLALLLAEDDRPLLVNAVSRPDPIACPAICAARLSTSLDLVAIELVPIRRRGDTGTVWLVTLQPRGSRSTGSPLEPSCPPATVAVAHDLRAPLQAILGWASLLKRHRAEPARVEHGLGVIERNAMLQAELVEDLLSSLRAPLKAASTRHHPVNLGEIVKAELSAVQPLADEKGVHVSLSMAADNISTSGDAVQLRRVVANLIGNALKFTPSGGAVECRLWRSAHGVGIAVRDNGQGIDCKFLPGIFEPFRTDPGQRGAREDGLGLGLYVVRQIVEMHGGKVIATSGGSGCGSTFTVTLPAIASDRLCGTNAIGPTRGMVVPPAVRSLYRMPQL